MCQQRETAGWERGCLGVGATVSVKECPQQLIVSLNKPATPQNRNCICDLSCLSLRLSLVMVLIDDGSIDRFIIDK